MEKPNVRKISKRDQMLCDAIVTLWHMGVLIDSVIHTVKQEHPAIQNIWPTFVPVLEGHADITQRVLDDLAEDMPEHLDGIVRAKMDALKQILDTGHPPRIQ
jgi:hypothetical protein